MITSTDAEVKENGSIILNAKILCDILRNLPEDRVSFEADERLSCKIKSGEAEFTLVGTSSAEYPELLLLRANQSLQAGRGFPA